jgi:hypothetical protein
VRYIKRLLAWWFGRERCGNCHWMMAFKQGAYCQKRKYSDTNHPIDVTADGWCNDWKARPKRERNKRPHNPLRVVK